MAKVSDLRLGWLTSVSGWSCCLGLSHCPHQLWLHKQRKCCYPLSLALLTSLFLSGQVFPEGTWAIITAEGSQVSPLDLLTLKSIPASECAGLCQAAHPHLSWGSPLCHAQYGCLSPRPGQDAGSGAPEKTQRPQKNLNKKHAKHWKQGRKEKGRPGYRCAAAGRLKLQVEKVTEYGSLSFGTVKKTLGIRNAEKLLGRKEQ